MRMYVFRKAQSVILLTSMLLFSDIGLADPLRVSQTISGPSGLLEMPTARMLPEGEFGVHFSSAAPYHRYAVVGQPLPWLQVLFKYTDIEYRLYGANIAGDQTYKDKSTDVKVRLLRESYFLPEVSLGINDIGGTGLFSGEYLVASKQVKNLDLSLGIGWGYLGSQGQLDNPFTLVSDRFNSRSRSVGSGGEVDTGVFFSGEKVSVFAGAEYHLEDYPLVLKMEYDANNYQQEPFAHQLEQKVPINIGAVYSFNQSIDLHLGYVRGTTATVGLTFRTNLKSSGPKKILDPVPIDVLENRPNNRVEWQELQKNLKQNAGLEVSSVVQDDNRLIVGGRQVSFKETAQGMGRASRILSNTQPASVEKFVFVDQFNAQAISAIEVDRKAFEAAAKLETDSDTILASTQFSPNGEVSSKVKTVYQAELNEFDYRIKPSFSGSFGGPDAFLLYQLNLSADANYYLRRNSWLNGTIQLGLFDNYENFVYTAPSNLPRVRTNIKEYLKTSKLRLQELQFTDLETVTDDIFWLGYIGYLESMYGGLGAEALYRPHGQNWALGLDVNHVKQRDFDQKFGFREYSVTTGHLTGYYETDSHLLIQLSAGQYLAKDKGVTLDISRKFRSGAKMGFWATKTNVSAEEFGEGSFDKGFYFSMPMNLFTFKSTTDTAGFTWQFLTRDGGQKLQKKYELYDLTDSRSLGYIQDSFENVLR